MNAGLDRFVGLGRWLRVVLALVIGLLALALAPDDVRANGENVKITLAPEKDENTVGEEHCVTATVTEGGGKNPKPKKGVPVRFSVSGANSASGSATTGTDGKATFCYTGEKAGTDIITAFADTDGDGIRDRGEPDASAEKTYKPGPPDTVTVAPSAATNTVGDEHCVTATVRDEFGNTVEKDVAVFFTVIGANPKSQTKVLTNERGEAKFCYTGTEAGQDVIKAVADADRNNRADEGEPSGTATKTFVPRLPAGVTLAPPTDTNTVGDKHCVTATVGDALGRPVVGAKIVFSVSGENPQPPVTMTTNESGQANFCYTGTKAGLDNITAFVDENGNGVHDLGEPIGTATKTYAPGLASKVTFPPEYKVAENVVGTQHCVLGKVTDAFGNPVGAGQRVVFSVTGANPRGPVTLTTDQNGNVVFCYTGTKAGLDTITAFVDPNGNETQDLLPLELGDTATKLYRPGAPFVVTVEPPTKKNVAGEEHCVTATVRDEFGNPVEKDEAVFFSVTGANPQAETKVLTDVNGQAQFCYTGTKAGTDTIKAVADADRDDRADEGEPSGTATKIYEPGPPAAVTLAEKTAENVAGEKHCVTATVTDKFDNPVEKPAMVIFSVTGANPQAETKVLTDVNGQAQFCYTGTKAGTDTITVVLDTNGNTQADEGEPSDTATKTYLAGPPAKVQFAPESRVATNPVDTEHCVTVTVTDKFDNPVKADEKVEFSVTGSVTTSRTKTTGADGTATFCYTGPALPGEDVITAFVDQDGDRQFDAGEPVDKATKTWVLPASTPNCAVDMNKETGGGQIIAANGDKFSFGGNAKVSQDGTQTTGEQEAQDHGPAEPFTYHGKVVAVVCVPSDPNTNTPARATIFTNSSTSSSVQGIARIDVTDAGEPGRATDTYRFQRAGYDTGEQPLKSGNIQIHKSA